MDHEFVLNCPNFNSLGYIKAGAILNDKHDRSAPSDYHWKILKCRMIIFSNSSILASPDKYDLKKIHIIFNKIGDDYDQINILFKKFSLIQEGSISLVTPESFQICFQYTLSARLAPLWNTLGNEYFINNRDFLVAKGPQAGIRYHILVKDNTIVIKLKPVKINLIRSDDDFLPGEWIRVLPSLNKAIVEECLDELPNTGLFKSYKDIRRHWKNIHGYRLPEEDCSSYCLVRFWRGDPLSYPKLCVTRNFPLVTPMQKPDEKAVILRFYNALRNKIPQFLGVPLTLIFSGFSETMEEFNIKNKVDLCEPGPSNINFSKRYPIL
ncbi:hypothetical protein ABMA27_013218 [Loxostege sticticalis]|uniref:DUF4708 domain-containing protein n=1 Tax=Loxostege sticticalis TaxID=481309 RepID=A0ABR3IEI6_LOXSC